ncbi:unnamed protein product, partial [marine sediment metagenome]
MDWLSFILNIVNRVPIERVFLPRPDHTKALGEFAATVTAPVAEKGAPSEQKTTPTITTQEPEPAPQQEDIATACVPCATGHFAGAAKLLNEAFRFRDGAGH